MAKNKICPVCMNGHLAEQSMSHTDSIQHDGTTYALTADVPTLQCDKCEAAIVDARSDQILRAKLRAQLELLQPEEIKEMRFSLELTQLELSEETRIAVSTISRWEKHHVIQSKASDKLLRLVFADIKSRKENEERERVAKLNLCTQEVRYVGQSDTGQDIAVWSNTPKQRTKSESAESQYALAA